MCVVLLFCFLHVNVSSGVKRVVALGAGITNHYAILLLGGVTKSFKF